jgi:hypothetical protein
MSPDETPPDAAVPDREFAFPTEEAIQSTQPTSDLSVKLGCWAFICVLLTPLFFTSGWIRVLAVAPGVVAALFWAFMTWFVRGSHRDDLAAWSRYVQSLRSHEPPERRKEALQAKNWRALEAAALIDPNLSLRLWAVGQLEIESCWVTIATKSDCAEVALDAHRRIKKSDGVKEVAEKAPLAEVKAEAAARLPALQEAERGEKESQRQRKTSERKDKQERKEERRAARELRRASESTGNYYCSVCGQKGASLRRHGERSPYPTVLAVCGFERCRWRVTQDDVLRGGGELISAPGFSTWDQISGPRDYCHLCGASKFYFESDRCEKCGAKW